MVNEMIKLARAVSASQTLNKILTIKKGRHILCNMTIELKCTLAN